MKINASGAAINACPAIKELAIKHILDKKEISVWDIYTLELCGVQIEYLVEAFYSTGRLRSTRIDWELTMVRFQLMERLEEALVIVPPEVENDISWAIAI